MIRQVPSSPSTSGSRRPSGHDAPASSVATLTAVDTKVLEAVAEEPEVTTMPWIRQVVLGFTSQWFLIPWGTGITAVVLHQLDYQFRGLDVISYVLCILALVSLALTRPLYIARIILFPKQVWAAIKSNQVEITCLSSISITLTSINQMLAATLSSSPNTHRSILSFVIWWIDMVIALAASLVIPVVFAKIQPQASLEYRPPCFCRLLPPLLLPQAEELWQEASISRSSTRCP